MEKGGPCKRRFDELLLCCVLRQGVIMTLSGGSNHLFLVPYRRLLEFFFYQNPYLTFWVMLLPYRQINVCCALVEVIKGTLTIVALNKCMREPRKYFSVVAEVHPLCSSSPIIKVTSCSNQMLSPAMSAFLKVFWEALIVCNMSKHSHPKV